MDKLTEFNQWVLLFETLETNVENQWLLLIIYYETIFDIFLATVL